MWESPRQMQAHTPFPSWIPYAGTFAAGGGPAAAAAPSLASEHGPDHAWNQSAPSVVAHGGSGYRGNFLSLLEAKNVTPEMFVDDVPAACDYLGGVAAGGAAASSSMAGPASACGLLGNVDPYSTVASSAPPVKHETASSPLVYSGDSVVHGTSMGCMPCYDHEEKPADDSQRQGFGASSTAAFLQQTVPSRVELQSALLGYSGMVSERVESSFGVGSLPDAGSFSDYNRSSADFMSSNSNRQEQDIRPGMGMGGRSSGSGAATSVATRRKSEERVGGNTKKSKQEASHKTSPPKPQAPKVKLGEKITALQQIVSPFGKTDTSSVLFETIEYIKFLHEQIRLFSEPYMTKSTYKGHIRRRGEEKEEESGTGHDLRGRGLCLVPVSLTSQAYHDDATLPDCWAPAYRSCLYP
ncbi:unnamed protein product [Miscanthus lutarioriparius]|uniref:BHLH domain-containing protein n=1 Tax=Miscanthus lutarioriparius TaxID=422564 RepID=A0A811QX48_9POAL|nr:unnamed protein product [Miscanthus lutarioriparius]